MPATETIEVSSSKASKASKAPAPAPQPAAGVDPTVTERASKITTAATLKAVGLQTLKLVRTRPRIDWLGAIRADSSDAADAGLFSRTEFAAWRAKCIDAGRVLCAVDARVNYTHAGLNVNGPRLWSAIMREDTRILASLSK